jgi:hypothetical protein
MAFASVPPENRASGIYEIICLPTGKRYIGSAKEFHSRWKCHRRLLRLVTHHSRHLQAAWAKYGEDNFAFRRLLLCASTCLVMYEQIAMDAMRPEFNMAPVAGNCLGMRHTAEAKAKQSARMLGNQHTLGHKHRPESIELIRAAKAGNTATKGKPRNPEAVAATAEAHRGMKRSEATRAKISAKAIGRRWSEEAKAKLSATNTGRKLSDHHRQTLLGNQHAAGRTQTPEERLNRSEKMRDAWAAKKAAGIPWRQKT